MINNEYIKKYLDYLGIEKYSYDKEHKDVFTIPRPTMNIVYIEKGYAKLSYNGDDIYVPQGNLIFIPKSSIYQASWFGKQITIKYRTARLASFYKDKDSPIQTFSLPDTDKLSETLNFMLNFNDPSESSAYALLARFFSLLSQVYKNVHFIERSDDKSIKNAIKYIENNYDKKFHVHELAKVCNMSDTQFFLEFKTITGYTPVQYKNIILIQHIQKSLNDENLSIKSIAEKYNFSSAYYFCKLFKSLTGKTPTEYRNKF